MIIMFSNHIKLFYPKETPIICLYSICFTNISSIQTQPTLSSGRLSLLSSYYCHAPSCVCHYGYSTYTKFFRL